MTEEELRVYYTDFIFNLYNIAINKQMMSFEDCEGMDILGYIDFLYWNAYRKEEENE